MVFLNNIPQPTVTLANSQPQLLGNNMQLDTTFGVDHYAFSNLTGNNGFHNKVSTPAYVASPPTSLPPVSTISLPIFYGFQQTANLGTIQYSRGWQPTDAAAAAPSPVTNLQSSSNPTVIAPSSSINILDFTGIPRAMVTLYAMDTVNQTYIVANFGWSGTAGFRMGSQVLQLGALFTGNILQLFNNNSIVTQSNVYWTLEMLRLQ